MSRLPSRGGPSWEEASDDYSSYIPESGPSSYPGGSRHALPSTGQSAAGTTTQTVLVAGCTSGRGLGVAEAYAAAGARIFLTSRSQDTLDQAVSRMGARHPGAEVVGRLHDFSDEAAVRALWRDLGLRGVFVDVLILNVAKKWPPATLLGLGSKKGRSGYSYNLMAPGFWTECFVRQRERDPTRDLYLLDLTSEDPTNIVPVLLSAGSPAVATAAGRPAG